jgi:hypothetical protein
MAAPRFLANIAGRIKMIAAIATSAGAGDADKIPATNASGVLDPTILNAVDTSAGAGDSGKLPQLDSTGRLDDSFMPVGIAADVKILPTSENLAAGDLVNIYNASGTATARKADATSEGKEASGFVLEGTTSPANATVYMEGPITGLTGLTPGARQYLDTSTPGATVETAPSSAGNVVQYVGLAISATEISFEPSDPITVA